MGQELILVGLAAKKDQVPDFDWEAGREAVRNNEFEDFYAETAIELGQLDVDYDSSSEDIQDAYKDHLVKLVDQLEEGFRGDDRSLTWFPFGEWEIFMCDGSSWGDSPSNLFNVISDLIAHSEEVLRPIGFDWPRSEED